MMRRFEIKIVVEADSEAEVRRAAEAAKNIAVRFVRVLALPPPIEEEHFPIWDEPRAA